MNRRLLITGLSGTLAPHLARLAASEGWEVLGWDRHRVPPEDVEAVATHLQASRPDAIAHLALGPVAWAGGLARFAARQGLPLLFTSTAMVFHHEPDGPHLPGDPRTARDDYGRSKIEAEDWVRLACPEARIARLGWQIDEHSQGNNMLATLDRWQQEQGCIAASRRWIPACSFMADTAAALMCLLNDPQSVGQTVHLDSNAASALSFDMLVLALARRFERPHWRIEVHENYTHDQRLVDPQGDRIARLTTRLALDA